MKSNQCLTVVISQWGYKCTGEIISAYGSPGKISTRVLGLSFRTLDSRIGITTIFLCFVLAQWRWINSYWAKQFEPERDYYNGWI